MKVFVKNFPGFSLLELIVAIAVVGIIATIGVPAIGKMQERAVFDRESQALIEAIRDVRNAALNKKNCANNVSAAFWEVQLFSGSHSTNPHSYDITCQDSDGNTQQEKTSPDLLKITSLQKKSGSSFSSVADGDTRLRFYTHPPSIKFIDGDANTPSDWYDSVRVVMSQGSRAVQSETLCMHRVQGFLNILAGDTACP